MTTPVLDLATPNVSIHVSGDLHLSLGTSLATTQSLQRIEAALTALQTTDRALSAQGVTLMVTVQQIQDQATKALAAIADESSKDDAIILLSQSNTALITTLKQQLSDAIAGGDQAALQGVLDSMTAAETSSLANSAKVLAAVNAGTSPAPPDPTVG